VHRMQTPAVGCILRRGHDRLRDHEPAEQVVAEPIGRITGPDVVAVASQRQELDHLRNRVLGVGCDPIVRHFDEPTDRGGTVRSCFATP